MGLFHSFLQIDLGLGGRGREVLEVQPWSRGQRACGCQWTGAGCRGLEDGQELTIQGQRQRAKKRLAQGDRCQGCCLGDIRRRGWARALWSFVGEKLPEGQVSGVIWRAGELAGRWCMWGGQSAGGTAGTEPSPVGDEEVLVESRHLEATAVAEGH